ncbi:hypothetical protein SAMN05519104_4354 [Rhizobiales bacterium GAS188]|nr:hypothetical protein SAMN05519104_4354 [Rhizobiales bacterium GAS188]
MSKLCISTRGIGSWRERLADPDRQWRRRFSAFETAVSWEFASLGESGIPEPIGRLFRECNYGDPILVLAVAEHKVNLPGGVAASQSDVWAVVKTTAGMLSLTVEGKANEAFGDEIVKKWLVAGKTKESCDNRKSRFEHILSHLPKSDSFLQVRYQLLHRCAASVIEAKRLGFQHAAFVVQAFNTPDERFQDYAVFCQALKLPAVRGSMETTCLDGISLSVGWADCPLATDAEVATSV